MKRFVYKENDLLILKNSLLINLNYKIISILFNLFGENVSRSISDKWQDKEYREKQLKARKELGKDPKFREKMQNINRERGKDAKFGILHQI